VKSPRPRGDPVNALRVRGWLDDFAGYRVNVTEGRIDRWIEQFQRRHRDLAARILDSVDFVSRGRVAVAFRQVLSQIPGWNLSRQKRKGRWVFVPFTASAGESGDTMLREFRVANGMGKQKFNYLFKYKSDLPGEELGPADTVVFVDDFAGTGQQAIDHWEQSLEELLPQQPTTYLVLVVTSRAARKKIDKETGMVVVPNTEIGDRDNMFHESCKHFSRSEKKIALKYCTRAKPDEPRGFGGSGLLVVFSDRCPNNTIPILHESNNRWEGLFRRSL